MAGRPEQREDRIFHLREPLSCIKIALDEIARSGSLADHAMGDIARAVADMDREIEAWSERDNAPTDSGHAVKAGALLEEVLRDLRPALAAARISANTSDGPADEPLVDPIAWRGRCLDAFHAIFEWVPPGCAVELCASTGRGGAELELIYRGDSTSWGALRTALGSVPGVSARHATSEAP